MQVCLWVTATSASTECQTIWIQSIPTSGTFCSSYTNQLVNYIPPPHNHSAVVDRVLAQRETVRAHPTPAQTRARDLLLSHLTSKQRTTFKKNRWFVVEGGRTRRRYRVRADLDLIANIEVLEGNRVSHRLCAHADIARYPHSDHLLAQKLMLEHDEDEFLKVANRHAA
jgi:hypothetical protein